MHARMNSSGPRDGASARLQILKEYSGRCDINSTRRALLRGAVRAPMAVIPLQNHSVNVQQVARIAAASASAAVARPRQTVSAQLHSNVKFDAVASGEDGGTCPPESHRLSRHPESTTQRGLV
jgi:hypothetical protein